MRGWIAASDGSEEPGNQQAGFDLRLSLPVAGHEFGLYFQSFAEDGSDSSTEFTTKAQPSGGIDTTVSLLGTPVLMYVEYTDSLAYCGSGRSVGIGNCYYEHHIYQTGMRYEGRAIGNLYDNDATSVVFGMISQTLERCELAVVAALCRTERGQQRCLPRRTERQYSHGDL
jgi:hypothetical protein